MKAYTPLIYEKPMNEPLIHETHEWTRNNIKTYRWTPNLWNSMNEPLIYENPWINP